MGSRRTGPAGTPAQGPDGDPAGSHGRVPRPGPLARSHGLQKQRGSELMPLSSWFLLHTVRIRATPFLDLDLDKMQGEEKTPPQAPHPKLSALSHCHNRKGTSHLGGVGADRCSGCVYMDGRVILGAQGTPGGTVGHHRDLRGSRLHRNVVTASQFRGSPHCPSSWGDCSARAPSPRPSDNQLTVDLVLLGGGTGR